ncbi:MAG: response regulator transcription factor [Sneathiella sp.]
MHALIVDKFEICRQGFKVALEASFDDVTICEANTVNEALACLNNHGSDIVLLTMDNINKRLNHALSLLQEAANNTPVVVVGEAENFEIVKEAFDFGIKGFLDRSNSKSVMIAAIQLVLAGGLYFPPEIQFKLLGQAPEGKSITKRDDEKDKYLTRRQLEVLRYVALGNSNKMIAQELGIAPGTVKVHISNLMRDLQAKNRTQAVSIANELQIL